MSRAKIDGQSERQASLFDMIEEIDPHKFAEPNFQIETKPLSNRIKEAISEAMKNSGLKRYAIAGQMSELLAVEITESMLNSYTAESKECHRMPAEYIPIFCRLTKDYTVLEILVAAAGGRMVVGMGADLVPLGRVEHRRLRVGHQRRCRRDG